MGEKGLPNKLFLFFIILVNWLNMVPIKILHFPSSDQSPKKEEDRNWVGNEFRRAEDHKGLKKEEEVLEFEFCRIIVNK